MFKSYWLIGVNPSGCEHFEIINTLHSYDGNFTYRRWSKIFELFGRGFYLRGRLFRE